MTLTRRSAISRIVAGACLPALSRSAAWAIDPPAATPAPSHTAWTPAWDKQLLAAAVRQMDRNYDPAEHMIKSYHGPEYSYQSTLRSTVVHSTRDAFEYALALLEQGTAASRDRACQVLERTIGLQEADPSSKYFGLWSYYLEEPLDRMNAVDFNWADFNGSTLLLILFRHRDQLPPATLASVNTALQRACVSIRKRDVTPYYTNIIAQGTYVVLAAAETFHDDDLLAYGLQRMRRWAQVVDQTGSFAEYNSPGYTPEVIRHMTSLLMFVHNPEARALGARLHHRAWQHFAEHWHVPTLQLAGPMSRAYSNDIGSPLWLQKGMDNAIVFLTLDEIGKKGGPLAAGLLDYNCPADLRHTFVALDHPHQHREMFSSGEIVLDTLVPNPAPAPLSPIQGTTLLTPAFALGSANRSDFWIQRRPLLAYWGGSSRPPRVLQLRVIKNDYDFSSATFYSVQQQGAILGAVGFRTDGGDKHPLIDKIKNGTFSLQQMLVEFLFPNWDPKWTILADGKPLYGPSADLPLNSRIAIDVGSCRIGLHIRAAAFQSAATGQDFTPPTLRWTQSQGQAALDLTLYKSAAEAPFHFADLGDAGAAFTCLFDDSLPLAQFDRRLAATQFHAAATADRLNYTWSAPAAALAITVRRGAHPYATMESAYSALIDNQPVPQVRLDDQPILQ